MVRLDPLVSNAETARAIARGETLDVSFVPALPCTGAAVENSEGLDTRQPTRNPPQRTFIAARGGDR